MATRGIETEARPADRTAAVVGAGLATAVALVLVGGVITLIIVVVAATTGALVATAAAAGLGSLRGRSVPESGDHGDSPGFGPTGAEDGAELERTEAGHVSPST